MSASSYSLSISRTFAHPVELVFDVFTDLTRIHLWNPTMLKVTSATRMHKGLVYTTETVAGGELSRSRIEVADFVPEREIRIINTSGVVRYEALVGFTPVAKNETRITCQMLFSLPGGILKEAQAVAEEIAKARIESNWDILDKLLSELSTDRER